MFKRKFTKEEVVQQLSLKPMTLFELESVICCSHRTAWNLVQELMDEKSIERRNRSSPKKPVWEYYTVAEVKPAEEKKFTNMMIARIR